VLEDFSNLIVVEEDIGKVPSKDCENTERISSYYFFRVVDELIEMGETFHETSLYKDLVMVLTKTTEKQGIRFPVSTVRTVDNLRYSICNFLYQINPTTANKG
jgi:hypothetical protein